MNFMHWRKGTKEKKVICSNCKTGKENYLLDDKSWTCPFVVHCDGEKCLYYKPLIKQRK